jgi:hypothetical protein
VEAGFPKALKHGIHKFKVQILKFKVWFPE